MTLTDIAFLNLRRRKAKAAFILAGLMIGVATVVALVTLFQSVSHDILHKMEKYGANIMVVPATKNLSLSYGGIALGGVSFDTAELTDADVAELRGIPSKDKLAAVGPVVLGAVKTGTGDALLAGVDFGASKILKPWWSVSGAFPAPGEVALGSAASSLLGVGTGGEVAVDGKKLKVSGVLAETGSQDDQLIFTDLVTAQALLGKQGKVSMVEVAAHCMECPIDKIIAEIFFAVPGAEVKAIKQVVEGRMNAMQQFEDVLFGISGLVVLVGCLVVLVTMMGSVRERTSEIGVFRAIGFRKSHIMKIILLEAAVISTVAGALGYAAGLGITKLALPLVSEASDAALSLDPMLASAAVAASLTLGLLSSLYPALIAARMDPNEALRTL
jgi:putative ABC transport system permease protein